MSIGDELLEAGWTQGAFVSVDCHQEFDDIFRAEALPNTYRILIASQTCDIICRKDDLEKYVECIVVKCIDHLEHKFGKNPRIIDFSANTTSGEQKLRATQALKLRVPRDTLLRCNRDEDIT